MHMHTITIYNMNVSACKILCQIFCLKTSAYFYRVHCTRRQLKWESRFPISPCCLARRLCWCGCLLSKEYLCRAGGKGHMWWHLPCVSLMRILFFWSLVAKGETKRTNNFGLAYYLPTYKNQFSFTSEWNCNSTYRGASVQWQSVLQSRTTHTWTYDDTFWQIFIFYQQLLCLSNILLRPDYILFQWVKKFRREPCKPGLHLLTYCGHVPVCYTW